MSTSAHNAPFLPRVIVCHAHPERCATARAQYLGSSAVLGILLDASLPPLLLSYGAGPRPTIYPHRFTRRSGRRGVRTSLSLLLYVNLEPNIIPPAILLQYPLKRSQRGG